ncbi:MAG: thiamine phosphate synthase [Parvibaculaceae bacterium]|nr:thiamine phosphate synthase [Parvibaculaceae bacterium]
MARKLKRPRVLGNKSHNPKNHGPKTRGRKPALPRRIGMTDNIRNIDGSMALRGLRPDEALIDRTYRPVGMTARPLAALARARHIRVLQAGAPRAIRPPVGGCHLPEWALRRFGSMVKNLPAHLLVTAAAHGERAVIAAARAGVDAVLISPVFATASHPGGKSLGVIRFARLARQARSLGLGVYALGGTGSPASIRRLGGIPISGIAGIGFLGRPQA